MGYSARTLVDVVAAPAALVDADGSVLAANAAWPQAPAAGPQAPADDPQVLAALRAAVLACAAGDERPVLRRPPGRAIRVLPARCDCGTATYLITVEPAGDRTGGAHPAAADRATTAANPADTTDAANGTHSTETAVAAAADAADAAVAAAKAEFLALLGHEIRTPVTGVVGMVDLLRALPLDQDVREVVDGVHRSTHALRSMVDDLLDLARMETGHFDLDERPVPLRGLLEDVTGPLQQQARQRGILLLPAVAPDLPSMIVADAARLGQVLTNLVGNAVKYTDAGEVVVTAERSGSRLLITVSDTGAGLGERDRARVLAPFVRADSSAARRHEGAGLGLALAARLVARMGGTVEVDSVLGKGSTFRLLLPLSPGEAAEPTPTLLPQVRRIAVAAPTTRSATALTWLLAAAGATVTRVELAAVPGGTPDVDVLLWCGDARSPAAAELATDLVAALGPRRRGIMVSTTDPRGGGVVRGPAVITAPLTMRRLVAAINAERTGVRGAPVPVAALPAGRVLLVEDNEVNRVVFQRMIELLGVDCDTAGTGPDAVRAVLGDRPYDVVLMDVQMPGMDGLAATRRIRAAGATVPVLALTATALRGDRERCLAAGMNDHLQKPITLPELRSALANYLDPPEPQAPAAPATADAAPTGDATPRDRTTGDGAAAVDLDRLRGLAEELGDRPLVVATVSTFLAELGGRRGAMVDALGRGDRDALRATAHTLKSSSALLGADTLAALCAAVERGAPAAAHAELAALLADLETAAAAAATAMTAYVATP